MESTKRRLYENSYRDELNTDITTQSGEPGELGGDSSTTSNDGLNPEEVTFRKRYSDLRSHTSTLTERIKSLETQLGAAQRKEVTIPSTKEELNKFAQTYPDVFRHIRSIAMTELLQERENIAVETENVKEDLNKIKLERGRQRILTAHPDFEELNLSEAFHEWARLQPKQLQDWMFASDDPDLCIKALDLYKVETGFKTKRPVGRPRNGADSLVNPRGSVDVSGEGDKRIWKGSEIERMHPKLYEQHEASIEKARTEGRIDMNA